MLDAPEEVLKGQIKALECHLAGLGAEDAVCLVFGPELRQFVALLDIHRTVGMP